MTKGEDAKKRTMPQHYRCYVFSKEGHPVMIQIGLHNVAKCYIMSLEEFPGVGKSISIYGKEYTVISCYRKNCILQEQ